MPQRARHWDLTDLSQRTLGGWTPRPTSVSTVRLQSERCSRSPEYAERGGIRGTGASRGQTVQPVDRPARCRSRTVVHDGGRQPALGPVEPGEGGESRKLTGAES